jgi:hypothetical protein
MENQNTISNEKMSTETHYTKESIMALIPQSVKDNFEVVHHPESNHFQFLYSKGGGLASTFFPISKLISIDDNETTIEFNTKIFKVMVFKNIPCIHTIIYND